MKLVNPETRSQITGAGGKTMGRGGRNSEVFADEWPFNEWADEADKAIFGNTRCAHFFGTPNGPGNNAYRKRFGELKDNTFIFDWRDDPRKTQDWYQNLFDIYKRPPEIIAQEVDHSWDVKIDKVCINGDWVNAAVELYEKIKMGEIEYVGGYKAAGMDVAGGGKNKSVMVVRDGIMITDIKDWNIENNIQLTHTAAEYAEKFEINALMYDVVAIGLGVKSAFESSEAKYLFEPIPINNAHGASDLPLEGDTKPARERCLNRRAEIVERVRRRFERTFENMRGGASHDIDSLIAIPNHGNLKADLQTPWRIFSKTGKVRVEGKEDMRSRGIDSPDFFDALMYSFADEVLENRVIRSFSKTNEHIFANFPINWFMVGGTPDRSGRHYISIYHDKNSNIGIIGGIVWTNLRKLQVYKATLMPRGTVSDVMNELNVSYGRDPYEYVGNKELFLEGKDDIFMQYLDRGVVLNECQNEEMAAFSMLNQLFDNGSIQVHKDCIPLARQLSDMDRTKGNPDKTNMALVLALCSLVNRLEEMSMIKRPMEPIKHYGKSQPGVVPEKEDENASGWILV